MEKDKKRSTPATHVSDKKIKIEADSVLFKGKSFISRADLQNQGLHDHTAV